MLQMCAIVFTMVMAATLLAAFSEESDAASPYDYIDVDGELKTYDGTLDTTSFGPDYKPSMLYSGWYYAAGSALPTLKLTISGDVYIIIKDGGVLKYSDIIVLQNSNLYIYSQTKASNKGVLSIVPEGGSIFFEGGSSITNTAKIMAMGDNFCITGSPAMITIGVTGEIHGIEDINVSSACTINNYGVISSPADFCIYISGESNIVNNYGTISTWGDICIDIDGDSNIINNYGTIVGAVYGIYVRDTGYMIHVTLVNSGVIEGDVLLGDYENYVTFVAGSTIKGNFTIGADNASTLHFIGGPEYANGEFVFSTVTGISNIGNATVSFDVPAAYDGEVIVLIDGSTMTTGSIVSGSFNASYLADGFKFTISIRGNNQLITSGIPNLFPVIYDDNGGYGGPGTPTLADGAHPISSVVPTHVQENVLFMGWTTDAGIAGAILDKNGTVPILAASVVIDGRGVTLYAVWGIDTNGNGIPDILEPTVQPEIFTITATAGEGSTISPSGTISVTAGTDRTFTFSAEPGYRISAVYVNGIAISNADLISGEFTLRDIQSDHTIEVVCAPADSIILVVEIVGGDGMVKYRIGPSGEYVTLTGPQSIPLHSDLYISIEIGTGYKFAGWTGYFVSNGLNIHIPDAYRDIILTANIQPAGGGSGGSGGIGGEDVEAGPVGSTGSEWSLLNLIIVILAILTTAAVFIIGKGRHRRDDE